MKKLSFILSLCYSLYSFSQVGINTTNPSSTLTIEGSLETAYKEVTSNTSLSINDHYITYNGSSDATVYLPAIGLGLNSFTGRIYKIKNISDYVVTIQSSDNNMIRVNSSTPISTFKIPAYGYIEIINNSNTSNGTWDLSYTANSKLNSAENVELYGTQLKIPGHGKSPGAVADFTNHSNTSYDSGSESDRWWVISKSSTSYENGTNFYKPSRMVIVYEYQGTPFNINNVYPILTAGNNSNYPDTFNASFISLLNNGTDGKTRLTISVSRADYFGKDTSSTSNWLGTFLLNVLLARKYN